MKRLLTTALMSFVSLLAAFSPAYAHEGHDEVPGAESTPVNTVVTLSDTAIRNLGIETVRAAIAPQARVLRLNAVVEFPPEKQAIIAPPAAGRVSEIYAKVGDKVSRGQNLLAIQPVSIGSGNVTLTSPIEGYVTKQNVVLGQPVTTETVMMEVGDPAQMLVRGVMFETPEVAEIKTGQQVRISGSLLRGKELTGTVQRADSGFEKESRTSNVYALVDNNDRLLLPNMQVKLSVLLGEPADVLTVPVKAILGESGEYFLFVKSGNDFERRSVTLGQHYGNSQEILEGVFPDEDVVTVGNYQLQFAKPAAPKKEAGHKD